MMVLHKSSFEKIIMLPKKIFKIYVMLLSNKFF